MSAPAIEVRGVGRRFRSTVALDDVDLAVEPDTIVGLMGRNGAGKTTLMALLAGQDFPTAGSVRIFGEDPVENDAVLSRLCFVREAQQYPNNFRVAHVLGIGPHFYPEWDSELAERLVDAFGLPRRRQVQKLSRGMRAAVGVITGLASQAPLTIFDEPVLGLDATSRQLFYDELIKAYAERPRTILLSTHLIDEAAAALEQVVVLDRGRVALSGDVDELRRRASTLTGPVEAVHELIGSATVLHQEPLGGYVRATVELTPSPDLRSRAQALGVDVSPVPLQALVVRTGLLGAPEDNPASEGALR